MFFGELARIGPVPYAFTLPVIPVGVRRTPRSLTCPCLTDTKTGQYTLSSQCSICYSIIAAPPLSASPPRTTPSHQRSPVTRAVILFFGFWEYGVGRQTPLETRVWHGRLSSRALPRIGPAPCHVSVGVGIGTTGSSLRFVLSTKAGHILPGVCFVYASIPPVNQFVFKTWPVSTLEIHLLK